MKNIIVKKYLLAVVLLITTITFAQSPESFNYQAVIRDASNNILSSQPVGIQFRLLQGSPAGASVYTETHSPTTDTYGVVALAIGTGTTSDDFSIIDWSNGPYFLEIAADITGGTSYSVLGTQQLMSVPYALYAKTAGTTGPTNEVSDADNDTKIQVEETADEDIIRFDIAGVEKWVFKNSRIEPVNSGNSIHIGKNAGANDDLTDNNNVFLGDSSGAQTTSGSNNIGIGDNTLSSNITGGGNIAIGRFTQIDRQSGQFNTSIGTNSFQKNTTGENNTVLGSGSFLDNINGNGNVGIGNGTGQNNNGSYNVFIGYQSGRNANGSNLLSIDNSSTATPLIYGEFDNDLLRINGTLNINNAFSFPTTDGAVNQVLQTDGTGNLTWQDDVNHPENIITDANNDTKIQVEENADDDIIRFDMGGTEFFRMDSGRFQILNTGNSIFIGQGAGANDDLSNNRNIFIGFEAGQANTTAIRNNAIGYQALYSNTTGNGNVANGYQVLYSNTLGQENTANGNLALYSNTIGQENTANGNSALYSNTIGRFNTANGYRALLSSISGDRNIANGHSALFLNTTGNANTANGDQALYSNISGNNNIATGRRAGYNSLGDANVYLGFEAGYNETGSNKLYIENSNSTSPLIYGEFNNDLLRINGTLNINDEFSFPTTDGTADQILSTDGAGNLTWTAVLGNHTATQNIVLNGNWLSGDGGNEGVKVYNNGFVQIGAAGNLLHSIIKVTVFADVPQVGQNNAEWVEFAVPNAQIGGVVSISPSAPLSKKMVIAQAYVSAVGTVMVAFRNTGNASNNPAGMNYYISVIN